MLSIPHTRGGGDAFPRRSAPLAGSPAPTPFSLAAAPLPAPEGCWKGWFMIACLEVSLPDLSAFQEFFERHSLTAARAGSARSDSAHEAAALTALLAQEACFAL